MMIFVNAESYNDIMCANLYNNELTGGIYFEDRAKNFEYKNESWFEFTKLENYEIDEKNT